MFLGVLNGSFIFASDLLRAIDFDAQISFIKMSSYSGTSTTGTVKQLIGINEDLTGRTLVIVEDIVETGISMEKL
ncbi:MAG: hypoxanthine phosphoribosyltransferase, partial [Bacteroidales bacterium]|nr:hypoxanthine phosphoribosyltransferase [Bacteroidales bacterium]